MKKKLDWLELYGWVVVVYKNSVKEFCYKNDLSISSPLRCISTWVDRRTESILSIIFVE